MDPRTAYIFCPRCGNKLKEIPEHLECTSCGFIFYINPIPCNAVVIENEKQEILLAKRKFDPKKGYWDLPGGFLKTGENYFESVKREIKEELHIEIKVTGIVGIYEDTYLFQNILNPTLLITAAAKILSGILKADDDVSDYKFFPREQVLQQKLSFSGIQKSLEDYLCGKSYKATFSI
jgi:NADH pyrophosphatase NudC (nudix superfamily)